MTNYKYLSIALGVAFIGSSLIALTAILAFNEISNLI